MSFQYFLLKRAACAGAALLLAGLLAGCGTQAQNALKVQEDLSEAQRLVQVKPTDTEARQWADRAIAVAPQNSATYFGPDAAATGSSDLPAPLSIAAVFASTGDTPALATYMTQATQKFPSDQRGFVLLSQAQKTLGQTAAEKATAAQLVALLNKRIHTPGATNLDGLYEELAQAYFDAGDPVNGTATYTKAIQAYPTNPNLPNNLAYAYAVRGTNLPEALALAHQAITLAQKQNASDEQIAAYQDTLGWVQYQQGDYAGAEQSLLQAVNTVPRFAEIRYHLGLVYAAQGNTDAARSELSHAVLLAQSYAAAQQALDTLPKSTVPKPSVSRPSVPPVSPPAHPAPKAAVAASS